MADKIYKRLNVHNIKNMFLRRIYIVFLVVVVALPLFVLCCCVEGFKGFKIYVKDVADAFVIYVYKQMIAAWKNNKQEEGKKSN